MSTQQYALATTTFGLIVGASGLVATLFNRGGVARYVNGFWSKAFSIPMQILGLLSSVGATFELPHRKEDWLANAIVGAVAFAIWTTLQLRIDHLLKESEHFNFKELERAESLSVAYLGLFGSIRGLLDRKVSHIWNAHRAHKGKLTVKMVGECLRPSVELDDFLTAVCQFFIGLLPVGARAAPNFRAVVYVSQGGFMTPVRGCSYSDSLWEASPSFEANRDAFALAATPSPALAVTCHNRQATVIVADTVAAAGRGEFHFLHDDQRGYLQSILAFPLGNVCRSDRTLAQSVLVVDTNVKDFFREDDRQLLKFCFREFAGRIKLELMLQAMVANGEVSS